MLSIGRPPSGDEAGQHHEQSLPMDPPYYAASNGGGGGARSPQPALPGFVTAGRGKSGSPDPRARARRVGNWSLRDARHTHALPPRNRTRTCVSTTRRASTECNRACACREEEGKERGNDKENESLVSGPDPSTDFAPLLSVLYRTSLSLSLSLHAAPPLAHSVPLHTPAVNQKHQQSKANRFTGQNLSLSPHPSSPPVWPTQPPGPGPVTRRPPVRHPGAAGVGVGVRERPAPGEAAGGGRGGCEDGRDVRERRSGTRPPAAFPPLPCLGTRPSSWNPLSYPLSSTHPWR